MAEPQQPTTEGILVQLRLEIAAAGLNVKSTAAAMGVPYDSFRNYVSGERSMPLEILMLALATLHVDLPTFSARAIERSTAREAD